MILNCCSMLAFLENIKKSSAEFFIFLNIFLQKNCLEMENNQQKSKMQWLISFYFRRMWVTMTNKSTIGGLPYVHAELQKYFWSKSQDTGLLYLDPRLRSNDPVFLKKTLFENPYISLLSNFDTTKFPKKWWAAH